MNNRLKKEGEKKSSHAEQLKKQFRESKETKESSYKGSSHSTVYSQSALTQAHNTDS